MAVYRLADLLVRVEGTGKYTSRMLSGYQVEAAPCRRPIFLFCNPGYGGKRTSDRGRFLTIIIWSAWRYTGRSARRLCAVMCSFSCVRCGSGWRSLSVHRAFRHWEIHPCENVEGGFWKRSCHD